MAISRWLGVGVLMVAAGMAAGCGQGSANDTSQWFIAEMSDGVEVPGLGSTPQVFIDALKANSRNAASVRTEVWIPLSPGWMCYAMDGGTRERTYTFNKVAEIVRQVMEAKQATLTAKSRYSFNQGGEWKLGEDTIGFSLGYGRADVSIALYGEKTVKDRSTQDGNPWGYASLTVRGSTTDTRRSLIEEVRRQYASLPQEAFFGNCSAEDMKRYRDVTKKVEGD